MSTGNKIYWGIMISMILIVVGLVLWINNDINRKIEKNKADRAVEQCMYERRLNNARTISNTTIAR